MPHLQPLTTAFAVALLALIPLCASTTWNSDNATAPFEIDVIFPRNETYRPAGVFPISLAVQNFTSLRAVGNFTFLWHIMPYSHGWVPGGITWDEGKFEAKNPPDDNDTVVFVANTNVTEWIHQKDQGDRFRLQWHLEWDFRDGCDYKGKGSYVFGGIMFSIETEWEAERSPDGKGIGKKPNVLDVPECPILGYVGLSGNSLPYSRSRAYRDKRRPPKQPGILNVYSSCGYVYAIYFGMSGAQPEGTDIDFRLFRGPS
ncbi:hypothetical protein CEP51_014834 [Fusarium floridanum]|uniref:DUF7136 domain-containing protein n=1 Tax=Fusarium floridanum TaxID=1325733 RepID=A0A428PL37_9HYPO|nr:hypothetical protein CEP51_014834 [Fusarium floridanum]